MGNQPFKGLAEVIVISHDSPQPRGKGLSAPILRRAVNEFRVVAGMAFQRLRFFVTAAQLFLRKLADGLVHSVALVFGIRPTDHQRAVNQPRQDLGSGLPGCADRLGGFQGPASGKDRQAAQDRTLLVAQ